MNHRTILIPLLAMTAAGSAALQDDGASPDAAEAEKAALEQQVTELEARVKTIEGYLQSQAVAAATLEQALTASEAAGFTAGINAESREILLEGLGTLTSTAQEKVPGKAATKQPAAPRSMRGVRRSEVQQNGN